MNFSKLLRFLLIAVAMITVFSLFACTDNGVGSENSSDDVEGSDESNIECDHGNTEVDGNCQSVCSDCGAVLGTVDHTPAAPDPEDHCNVKCSNCGTVLEENKHGSEIVDGECYNACSVCGDRFSDKAKHTKGDPDPEDHCNIKCTNCGIVLFEGKHARTTEINDNCEEVCTACGDKMSDALQHLDPGEGAWALDSDKPQCESATCERCKSKIYRDVTATPQGLTLLGPETIIASAHNARCELMLGEDDNGLKYARIEIIQAGEGTVTLNTGAENLMGVGKYVAVLARRNSLAGGVDVWINSAGSIDNNGSVSKTLPIANDNSWQLLVFDFSTAAQISKENGVGWTRIDMNPDTAVGDYMDIAFIAFFDSADEAGAYYGEYVKAYLGADACTHTVNNQWKAIGEGKVAMTCTACESDVNVMECTHFDLTKLSGITAKAEAGVCYFTADCALCGATGVDIPSLTQEQGKVFMAAELNALAYVQASLALENNGSYSRYTAEYITNDGVIPYTRFVSKIDHENCLLLNDGTVAQKGINKYVAILYKKTGQSPNFEIFVTPAGSTAPGNHTNKTGATVNDGTWRLAIIDLSESDKIDVVNGAGWLRLDVVNNPALTGDTVDIAYVGFFSSTEKAYEHYLAYLNEYLGIENCCHSFSTEWSGTGEENKMQNYCNICQQTVVTDCDHVSNGTWEKTENEGEIRSTCTRCNAVYTVDCDHPDKTFNEAAGFFRYSYTCNLCGVVCDEEDSNKKDGCYIFGADKIVEVAGPETSSAKGTYTTVLVTDENTGLKYAHNVLSGTNSGECYLYFNTPTDGIIENTGDYFVILYRQDNEVNTTFDLFIASSGTLGEPHRSTQKVDLGGGWALAIFDYSKSNGWKSKDGAETIRLDLFNWANIPEGSSLDIAYAGFFSSVEAANQFYDEFATAYNLK